MKSVDLLKNKGVMNFTPIFLLIHFYKEYYLNMSLKI